MDIQDIVDATKETSPYFFSEETLVFFGQTLESFSIEETEDGRYRISAPYGEGRPAGETVRFFNPKNNKLERS